MSDEAKTARITSGKSTFGKFLGKHADELRTTTGILGQVIRLLPIDPKTKAGLNLGIEGLNAAADRIEAKAATADTVSISRDDIREAVSPILSEVVGDLVRDKLAEIVGGEALSGVVADAVAAEVAKLNAAVAENIAANTADKPGEPEPIKQVAPKVTPAKKTS